MNYVPDFSKEFEKDLVKIKRKDRVLFERVKKKINEILDNPEHYKSLRYDLKGERRVHAGHFVIIFELDENRVKFYKVKHHDFAYEHE